MDEDRVRALLEEQHPDLAHRRLVLLDSGWDNFTFRLGSELAVRLPRRQLAVEPIRNEQRWLPVLGPRLTLRVPVPVRTGRPGAGYPWPWSVVPWLPGRSADRRPPADEQAPRLAEFLGALHRPAPAEAPVNPFRGVPLRDRADAVERRLRRHRHRLPAGLTELWEESLRTAAPRERRWIHGDLHPRNLLVQGDALVGVIDWGDLTAGDPATDLAVAWMLFESAAARRTFLQECGPDTAMIARARGWAVLFGATLLDTEEPEHAPVGANTLRRLAEDRQDGR
ncbi:MAG: aminoglycoside phosphotransferase family protein [Acidobacteriota bacterium]